MSKLVEDFIKEISVSELYNISWIDDLTGNPKSSRIPTIISYINEGLLKLYDKFSLKKDQVYLFPYQHKFTYKISSEHNMDEDAIPTYSKYLWKGINEKFDDNLLRIINVYNSDGHELPINDPNTRFSVFIPFFNLLQLSDFEKDWKLSITYVASPKVIKTINDKIDLPSILFPALINYVAYKAYNTINTAESYQVSSKYFQLYTNDINELIQSDTANYSTAYNPIKFNKGGWA